MKTSDVFSNPEKVVIVILYSVLLQDFLPLANCENGNSPNLGKWEAFQNDGAFTSVKNSDPARASSTKSSESNSNSSTITGQLGSIAPILAPTTAQIPNAAGLTQQSKGADPEVRNRSAVTTPIITDLSLEELDSTEEEETEEEEEDVTEKPALKNIKEQSPLGSGSSGSGFGSSGSVFESTGSGSAGYVPPMSMSLTSSRTDEDMDEKLFLVLQNAVRETYFEFRDKLGKRYRDQMTRIETELSSKISQLDVDFNVKVVGLDTTTHSRIQSLTDQIIDQRKEDIQTFSDNLHQLQKTHQMHMDTQKTEMQQLQVTMDLMSKGHSSLSTKMTQLQKAVNNIDSKINEMVIKTSEDLSTLQDTQKTLAVLVDDMEKDVRASEAEIEQMHTVMSELEKAATEDNSKLRRTMMRDQKLEPIKNTIHHIKNKNIDGALKHWRAIQTIADDLKETLPSDISKIIDDSYGKKAGNALTVLEFIHKAVSNGDRRLREAAYASFMQELDPSKYLIDQKRTNELFHIAQMVKSDLGNILNTSSTAIEVVSKFPEVVRLVTFERIKLLLPNRGYLRVASDRKVTLVPTDGRFYDREEILWQFEYDKDKADGAFFIKSEKLQKYLVTLHEGFNSYGFSKQGLFVTGNKRENGTRFQVSVVNNGDFILFKSAFYNGFLSWKSNIQTIYGDDDSYFLLLVDRKNGPSPYWNIEGGVEN